MMFMMFYIGCCLGSFCNLVSDRLIKNENWILSRSYCEWCFKQLKLIHILPIVSYVVLNAKCPYCHKKISNSHLIVEVISGVCLCLFYIQSKYYIIQTIIMMILLVISLMDIKTMYFDARLLICLFIISIFYAWYTHVSFFDGLIGMLCLSIPLCLFKKSIGEGDLWILAIMGISLKLKGILLAFYISVFIAAFMSLFLIAIHKKERQDSIPFCPFLSLGIFFAFMLTS